jgi:hypothetical protein
MTKYRKVIFLSGLVPFLYKWRTRVAPSDIPLLEQYSLRQSIYRAVIYIPFALFNVYLYVRYLHPFLREFLRE